MIEISSSSSSNEIGKGNLFSKLSFILDSSDEKEKKIKLIHYEYNFLIEEKEKQIQLMQKLIEDQQGFINKFVNQQKEWLIHRQKEICKFQKKISFSNLEDRSQDEKKNKAKKT